MTIELVPELGVELTPDEPYVDLRSRAEAACRAIDLLQEHGFEIPPETPEDKEVAAKLTTAYAADPIKTSKVANHVNTASLTPASLMHLRSYLDEYGKSVVSTAVELRNVVTNRLIEESQNPDPRIRIRALELLGKISDVGLFTDKQEITITHQTTDELRDRLRQKLQKLVQKPANVVDVPPGSIKMDDGVIDVDAEMGFKPVYTPETPENPSETPENPSETPENPA